MTPALAGGWPTGSGLASTCAACDVGGGKVVNGAKTLKLTDLEKFDLASLEAIKTQVAHGKTAMPARL